MILALIFSELLGGGILLVAAITGHTPQEVIKGEADTVLSLKDTKPINGKEVSNNEKSTSSAKNTSDESGSSETGFTGESAPSSTAAPSPSVAGSLTWKSLEKDIKSGKLTEDEVNKDLEKLTGKKQKSKTPLKESEA